jgi:hypothetical protein
MSGSGGRGQRRRDERARRHSMLDAAQMLMLLSVAVDLGELVGGEFGPVERGYVGFELFDAAGADERGGDARVAEGPGDRQLRERLAAAGGELVERAHLGVVCSSIACGDRLLGRLARLPGGIPSGTCRSARPAPGREGDAADDELPERVEQLRLDPPVQQRVRRLMNEERRPPARSGSRVSRASSSPSRRRCRRTKPFPGVRSPPSSRPPARRGSDRGRRAA